MKKSIFNFPLHCAAILLAMHFVFALSAHADPVSLETAIFKAQRFLNPTLSESELLSRGTSAQTFKLAYEAKTANKAATCFYVLNRPSSEGYIIMSADDRLPEVLGYSDNGEFDINKIPDNMKWWLSEYERQIELVLSSTSGKTTPPTKTANQEGWTEIEPLVKTKWNQSAPYNNSCPTIDGKNTLTGCVATAMSQIMKYHEWPKTGRGSHSYEWNEETLSMDFSQITFDWDNMPNTNAEYTTDTQKNAVATLMKACGISVDMGYGLDASGAVTYYATQALSQYFDYDAKWLDREGVELSDWENLIYTELKNNRPVLYSGRSSEGGHAFVCDGYDNDSYFHINWGWGGYLDGHFLLSVLDPYEGAPQKGYNQNQAIIYGIRPIEKVEIDGVYYGLIKEENKAVVSTPDNGYYTGELTIPATVIYENKEYTVTEINNNIWSSCQDLTSLIVYAPINEIRSWDWDLSKSPDLETVELYNISHIGDYAFYDNCTNLKTLKLGDNLETIGYAAFYNCNALTELTIPQKVTSIGNSAFSGCKSLTTLKLGEGLKSIGTYAFYNCNALTELTIPQKVTSIGNSAFSGCNALTELTISEKVTSIGNSAFSGCNALTELTISEKVTSIGNSAFYGCTNLKTLSLGENLESIGSAAFYNCNALTELIIPDKVTSIADWTFSGCSKLTTLKLGESLESIGEYAFQSCKALTELTIPDKVTSIGTYAFYWCPALTTLQLGEGLETIGNNAFDDCEALKELIIPNKVTSIGDEAFSWGRSLTELVIPNSVTSIGKEAFYNCMRLKTIVIPNSVTTIGEQAFYDEYRYNDRTIISHIKDPVDLSENVFSDIAYSNDVLYIPYGTTEEYKAKEAWKNFMNTVEYLTVSVGADGLATYCPAVGVDFSKATDIAAYKASVSDGSTVNLTKVTTVAAGEGVLLRSLSGDAATEYLPVAANATANTDNAFVGVLEDITLSETDGGNITNFVLSKVNGVVGFFKANNTMVAAGKAYLPVEGYAAGARGLGIVFDDETTTGISEIEGKQTINDDAIYTLDGVRVKNPTKGLYIKNGKKVVIK